eukprot:680700-Hanusia_phi.AAC.2
MGDGGGSSGSARTGRLRGGNRCRAFSFYLNSAIHTSLLVLLNVILMVRRLRRGAPHDLAGAGGRGIPAEKSRAGRCCLRDTPPGVLGDLLELTARRVSPVLLLGLSFPPRCVVSLSLLAAVTLVAGVWAGRE